jgi:hypothetical protein
MNFHRMGLVGVGIFAEGQEGGALTPDKGLSP